MLEQVRLARVADHALEVEAERLEHGLGDRLHLLLDVVLAVERVLEIVERLRARRRHHVADEPARGLRRLARGRDVRRRARGVVVGRLAEVLAVDELLVELARAHSAHDVREIRVDALVHEQAPVELALHALREGGPVAAYDLEADEFETFAGEILRGEVATARAVHEPRVALARSPRAVARVWQGQFQVQLLELELEPAPDAPLRRA